MAAAEQGVEKLQEVLDAERRGLPLPKDAVEAGEALRQRPEVPSEFLDDALVKTVPKRLGRPPVPLETLKEAAEVYKHARDDGQPTTKAVAEHFRIKPERARRWVWLCRKASGCCPPAA